MSSAITAADILISPHHGLKLSLAAQSRHRGVVDAATQNAEAFFFDASQPKAPGFHDDLPRHFFCSKLNLYLSTKLQHDTAINALRNRPYGGGPLPLTTHPGGQGKKVPTLKPSSFTINRPFMNFQVHGLPPLNTLMFQTLHLRNNIHRLQLKSAPSEMQLSTVLRFVPRNQQSPCLNPFYVQLTNHFCMMQATMQPARLGSSLPAATAAVLAGAVP
eukprot:76709-Amphidinium_carterae.1